MFGIHRIGIKGQTLKEYESSSGGGMSGGYRSERVSRGNDGLVYLTYERAEWHHQVPTVTEYLVDGKILEELDRVVRRHGMNGWDNKKFTDMFIADGPTHGYSFSYDEAYFHFSSQFYPGVYRNKLAELDEVLARYQKDAEPLPGLVREENERDGYGLPEGETEVTVSVLTHERLEVRVLNGTNQAVAIPEYCRLEDAAGNLLEELRNPYVDTVSARSREEIRFSLTKRPGAGQYRLVMGDFVLSFLVR